MLFWTYKIFEVYIHLRLLWPIILKVHILILQHEFVKTFTIVIWHIRKNRFLLLNSHNSITLFVYYQDYIIIIAFFFNKRFDISYLHLFDKPLNHNQFSPIRYELEVMNLVIIIHILLGFILVYFAIRAYKRSRYFPMVYLAAGFLLITIGDTIIGDTLRFNHEESKELIEEGVEIAGFVLVIIAVLKS